jgi:hypothetical protein
MAAQTTASSRFKQNVDSRVETGKAALGRLGMGLFGLGKLAAQGIFATAAFVAGSVIKLPSDLTAAYNTVSKTLSGFKERVTKYFAEQRLNSVNKTTSRVSAQFKTRLEKSNLTPATKAEISDFAQKGQTAIAQKIAKRTADIATLGPITRKEAKDLKHQATEVGKSASRMIAIEVARAEAIANLGKFFDKVGMTPQQKETQMERVVSSFDPSALKIAEAKTDNHISADELRTIEKAIIEEQRLIQEDVSARIAAHKAKERAAGGLAGILAKSGIGRTVPTP